MPAGAAGDGLHFYVGTLLPVTLGGRPAFEGDIRALDSEVLRRDSGAAVTSPGIGKLLIAEQPATSPRARKRSLLATFALASGRYAIEAAYGSQDVFIVGRRLLKEPAASAPSTPSKSNPKTRP